LQHCFCPRRPEQIPQPEQSPRILPPDLQNVERIGDLLDEMTAKTDTRFIITHNQITMARMNRLYGVTMAERGVSQLVSVDLEGAVKLREAS
jgi:chromosome segregation protein